MHTASSADVNGLDIEIVTDSQRLHELGGAWRELWTRSSGGGLFDSFEYCRDAWEVVQEPQGMRLACLAGWQDGHLVAVWPFVTMRSRRWTHALPLGVVGIEPHDLVVDGSLDHALWTRAAWSALRERARADVVHLSFFEEGLGGRTVRSLPTRATQLEEAVSVRVPVRAQPDWDAYYATLSKSYRKDFAKSARRLERLGSLDFEVLGAGDERIPSLIEWTLAEKRRWADRTGKRGAWLYSERYQEFLERQLADPRHSAEHLMLTLTLDGQLLATQIGAVGKGVFEAVIAAFDASRADYSPGARMNDFLVRWAWEHQLDCDFGLGAEPYKTFWSGGRTETVVRGELAVSWWGAASLAVRGTAQRVSEARTSRLRGAPWSSVRGHRPAPGDSPQLRRRTASNSTL